MQLEDNMLSEVSQGKTEKDCLICGRYIQKINIYKKSKHGGTQTHMKNMFVIVELLHGTQEKREGKRKC
jgi:hypothetical protein